MIKEPCLYCGQAVDGTAGRARLRRRLSGLLVGVALGFPFPGRAQDSALPPNPFAGFETHHLANGLKVWLKRLPGDPVVSVSLAVPFGSDNDPPAKEQLAHFTEHMLFSDHLGRNEQEIKREIEELGGLYNAATRADETFYFVRIGKEHALFAIEWLYRIVSPHSMDPEIVDKQREPVVLELGARPRQFFDWLWAYYINPPALRPPGFWEREFGIKTRASRDYYPYSSLRRITPEDLRQFYDAYYVPSLMTLTVIGDVDRDSVLHRARETFAALPARPEPKDQVQLHDPARYRQTIYWEYRSDVLYRNRFKFYDLTADQNVMLIFLSRFLTKRLNEQLRFGQRKATYSIRWGIARRGPAAYLQVGGGIKPSEFAFAREVIEGEIEALRAASIPDVEFEADRAAVARQLRVANASAEDLERWVRTAFYDPSLHRDFPDLVTAFERITKDDAQIFVRDHFVTEHQVVSSGFPQPISQGVLLIIVVTLSSLTLRLARRRLIRRVEMTRIRYVARFRIAPLFALAAAAALLTSVAVAGRLLIYGFQRLADPLLFAIASFWVQWSAYALMFMATIFLLVLVLSRIPRKVLLFEDSVLVKYLSYRSVSIEAEDIAEVSLASFSRIWLSRRIWRCLPLTLGVLTPGIYLRRRDGRAWFFNVRGRDELLNLLQGLAAR